MTAEAQSSFRESVQLLLRDRLLDAAGSIICEAGWAAVTMIKIADRAGVSRQTVYNEFGNKRQIAEQLILRELDRFLDLVRTRMGEEREIAAALRSAAQGSLEEAAANPLLRAILGTAHARSTDLLPLMTTESLDLIEGATAAVLSAVEDNAFDTGGLDGPGRRALAETVVRMVLSHLVRPTKPPAEAAADVGWIVAGVVRGSRQA